MVGYRQNPIHQGLGCASAWPVPTLLTESSHILVRRN